MKIFLAIISSVIIMSCSQPGGNPHDYRVSDDGIFYFKGTNKLYSGTVSDTSQYILEYKVDKGKKNGSYMVYFRNGIVAMSGTMYNNKNVGEWRYYYAEGSLESSGRFVDDHPDGEWIFYHRDGTVKSKGSYKDGLRNGKWILLDDSGEIIGIYYFSNGQKIEINIRKT